MSDAREADAAEQRWIELFRQEFEGLAERIEAAGVALREAWSEERADEAFRALHTLQGNGFAVGYMAVGELAQRFEQALGRMRGGGGGTGAVPAVGELLIDVNAALRRMTAAPDLPAPPELLERIDRLSGASHPLDDPRR